MIWQFWSTIPQYYLSNSRKRKFVRFAEHDIGTQSDGPHEDIPIYKAIKHGQHNDDSKVNDIAMIYLERDVEFSGEFLWGKFVSIKHHECVFGNHKT